MQQAYSIFCMVEGYNSLALSLAGHQDMMYWSKLKQRKDTVNYLLPHVSMTLTNF